MKYTSRVSEFFEDSWKMDGSSPRGVQGSAIWDDNGNLKGLAIASMIPPPEALLNAAFANRTKAQRDLARESQRLCSDTNVYALPASDVLDFAETN